MNLSDIQEIHDAGLISEEQRRNIIDHFHLEHPRNRFLSILVTLGGVLVLVGVILVISANWNSIPGAAKIASGALLMCAAHFMGWKLRGAGETPSKLSEVFHFIGAGLFLANIALVGQVYHLSARTPNVFLLWLAGIVPLVWILRSVSIHILSLCGLMIWIGTEINAHDGWFYSPSHVGQFAVYASVGLLLYGCGLFLKRTSYAALAESTERAGVVFMHLGLWPLVVVGSQAESMTTLIVMLIPAVAGLALVASETRRLHELTPQWRATWLAVLAGWLILAALSFSFDTAPYHFYFAGNMGPLQALAAILIVAGCFVQMRVAEELRAPWMVNLAIVTTAFCFLATFGLLIGSMMNTGLVFLVGGAGILALGFWLEKKRRAVIQRINA